MDDRIAEVEEITDVDRLMAGIDALLAQSLAIMAQRQPSPAARQDEHEPWQRRELAEAY
jgi:hypothetical protein